MRVLVVGNLYPPHDQGGGYERVWRSAVAALRENGHVVRVLASDHREPGRGTGDEPDVHRELRWYWRDHAFPRLSVRETVAIERHNRAVLRNHLAAFAPDVVGWWSMGGMSPSLLDVTRRAGVPAVAFVHDDWLDYGPRVDGFQRLTRGRSPVKFASAAHFAFVSRATRDRAWLRGVATPERSVVSSGIDPALIDPAPERAWDGSLLYVGRVDRRKGLGTAIDALARLPEATLTIAGDGPDVDMVREHAARAGVADRVRLLGQVGPERLPQVYADCDAVVFPVEWEEPWGLVPLEAMGRGRPVVATGRGGSAEYLVDGGNALLFSAGDAEALAERVRTLGGDEALRGRLAAAGLDTAREHTEPRFNAQVEATLAAARIARRPRSPAPDRIDVVRQGEDWRSGSAPVVLFLGDVQADDDLIAAHTEAHRDWPGGVQGAIRLPRGAPVFAHWLERNGHPHLPRPRAGEVGPAYLDLRNVSLKRADLERAGGPDRGCLASLDLAYRLSEHGFRLRYSSNARVTVTRPTTLAEAKQAMPALTQELVELPQLAGDLPTRLVAHAKARGRLGRALYRWLPVGPVAASAMRHYERELGRGA